MQQTCFCLSTAIALMAGFTPLKAYSQYSSYNSQGYASASPKPQYPQAGAPSQSYYYGTQPGAQYPNNQQPYYQQQAYAPQPASSAVDPRQQSTPQAPVRYEQPISPHERPRSYAARTVPAGGTNVGGLNRPINFPRDAGDDVDILKLQIFLDFHGYSPGEIDGRWGYNTERALYVYQRNNGMTQTGQLDDKMMQRLNAFQDGYLLEYTLAPDDIDGPYTVIPRTYPEQAKLKWLPYESKTEEIAEKFHMSQTLLRKLNPGMDLDQAQPGQTILAINTVGGIDDKRGKVNVIKISKNNKWIEAYDSEGRFMFYYPTTLGSKYDELRLGSWKVATKQVNPPFKYQPKLFWDVDDGEKEEMIPPGPNSPVGNVWIGTTMPHVGIHGTPNPENISKNTSHGCIRLANWDARQLFNRVEVGTKIECVQ